MVVEAKRLPFESLAHLAERLAAGVSRAEALELLAAGLGRVGEALAAGAELERAARQAVREAKEATSAQQAAIWQSAGDRLELVASDGAWDKDVLDRARTQAL